MFLGLGFGSRGSGKRNEDIDVTYGHTGFQDILHDAGHSARPPRLATPETCIDSCPGFRGLG